MSQDLTKTKLIDFENPEDRTQKFDEWALRHDVEIKGAILGSDQALIFYKERKQEDESIRTRKN